MGESKTSEARKRANMKYDKKAYKKVLVRLKPDEYSELEEYTTKKGYSKNGFIVQAIKEKIQRDE